MLAFSTPRIARGGLGLSFYIIWHRQLKTITAPTFGADATEEPELGGGQQPTVKKEKPIGPDDIERLIKDG
jgi:hypothetical protein